MDDFEVDGENKKYTTGDDPNTEVLKNAQNDIRPSFLSSSNGNKESKSNNTSGTVDNSSNSNQILSNAEKNASSTNQGESDSDNTKADANSAEKLNGSNFLNNVANTRPNIKPGPGKFKGLLKKRGPLFALIMILGASGFGILSTQDLLPFALVSRAIQEWNSSDIVNTRRYRVLLNKMLRATPKETSKKYTNMFGDVKISEKQQKFFKKNGIEVIDIESDGKKAKALLVDAPDGKKKLILGNGKGSGINRKFRNSVSADMASGKLKGAENVDFGDNKAVTLKTALSKDSDFIRRFNNSSRAISGHVAGWFDNVFDGLRKRFKSITRNRWFGFNRGDDEITRNKNYKDRGKMPTEDVGLQNKVVSESKEKDEEGKEKTVTNEETDTETKGKTIDETKENLIKKARLAGKAAGGGASVASTICMMHAMMGAINAIKYSVGLDQILNYTSGFFEAVDKTKAGEGSESAMAEYLNDLSRPDENKLTGLSAAGIGALISGSRVNTADAYNEKADESSKAQARSALKFNFDDSVTIDEVFKEPSMIKDYLGSIKYTAGDMQKCVYGRIFSASVSLLENTTLAIFTGGLGTVVKAFVKETAKMAAVEVGIKILSKFFIPKVAELLMDDLVEWAVGPDLGNALASGANIYLAKNHQTGGGSPGTVSEVMAFKREQAAVLAENARVDRANLSPFDTSTNNTFLGNLAYSVIPLSVSLSSISTTTNKLSNLLSSSVANILPSASAIGETRLNQHQGFCPTPNSVGATSVEQNCYPYYISDTTSFGSYDQDDPFDPELLMAFVDEEDEDNFQHNENNEIEVNDEGNPIINTDLKNSELFQYINFCNNRDSMLGTADQNIANSFYKIDSEGTVSSILDAVPVVSDIKEITEAASDDKYADWISGRNCVADNTGKENPNWSEKMRLYQRFIEDQRLYENMGVIKSSSVQIALDDYYEENPLDTSETGIIARLSGLTKDQVETTLAVVDYFNYIAEYDPSQLYPGYKPHPVARMLGVLSAKNTSSTPSSLLYEAPIFVDLRNRNFNI